MSKASLPLAGALLDTYRDDIVAFAEREFLLPETGQPICLLEHQKRILKDCFTRDGEEKFPYQTIIYSCPKKSGKTTLAGLVALWFALTEGPYNEVYTPANDLEQSQSRVFRAVVRAIEANKHLRSVKTGLNVITFPNGTTIKTVAADYAGEAGPNPGLTIWDELWGYSSEGARRLYEELTPVPTRLNSIRLVVTYAGWEGESDLLESLYKQGMAGTRLHEDLPVWVNGSMYCYWDTEPRMPWQTPAYYEEQRRHLRAASFSRMHLNTWVTPETRFLEEAMWDACVDPAHLPLPPGSDKRVAVGVDAATKSDSAAVVGVYLDGGKVALAFHRIWPSPKGGLDLNETVLPYLRALKKDYRLSKVRFDPYQMQSLAASLSKEGLPMAELSQTEEHLAEATINLWELLSGRRLRLYNAPDLKGHALNAVAVENSRGGLRLAKKKTSRKIDGLVALSFAALESEKLGSRARIWIGDEFPELDEEDASLKGSIEFIKGEAEPDVVLLRCVAPQGHQYYDHDLSRGFNFGLGTELWCPRRVADLLTSAHPGKLIAVAEKLEAKTDA